MPNEDVVVFLRAQIGEFKAKMQEAGAETQKLGAQGEGAFSKFSNFGTAALLAVGVAALAVGAYGLKMADDYEKAHARLTTAVTNTGANFEQFKGQIGDVSKHMEDLGFTNADTESSLAQLTNATHDVRKAMTLQQTAADIARAKNIDLASATDILVKTEAGRFRGLAALGVKTSDLTKDTKGVEEAIRRVNAVVHGQADAYTETFAGKIEVLKTKGEDLAKNLGMALIPRIEQLVSGLLTGVTWLENFNSTLGGAPGKLAALTAGALLATAAVGKLIAISEGIPLIGAAVAALGPLALIVGGLAVSFHLLGDAINSGDSPKQTAALADGFAKLGKTGDAAGVVTQRLGEHMKDLASTLRDFKSEQMGSGIFDSIAHGVESFGHALTGIEGPTQTNINNVQKALLSLYKTDPTDALKAFDRIKESMKQQGVSADVVDKAFGKFLKTTGAVGEALKPATQAEVEQAAAAQQTAAEIKAHEKALSDLSAEVGPATAALVKGFNWTTDQVKALSKSLDDMDKSAAKAFDSFGATMQTFAKQAKVSFKEFVNEEMKQLLATQNWAHNMNVLADAGLNQGMLKKLEDAGPKSANLVQTLVDNIKNGSIKTFNDMNTAEQAALSDHQKHMDRSVVAAATSVDRWNAAVGRAKTNIALWYSQVGLNETLAGLGAVQQALRGVGTIMSSPGVAAVVHTNASILAAINSGKAGGGPVQAKHGYLVGENGPEFFMPKEDGTIVPNDVLNRSRPVLNVGGAGAGGGVQIVVNSPVTVNGTNLSGQELEDRIVRGLSRRNDAVVAALARWQRGNQKLTSYLDRVS